MFVIKDHPFNHDLSFEVYNECSDFVHPKECYSNVYYVAAHYAEKFHAKEWKVAYGFIRIMADSNMWARHAFIVNKQGEAIDPTFFSHENYGNDKQHKSFHIFRDITGYAAHVRRNQNVPDLLMPLREKEAVMGKWAEENGMVLLGGMYTGMEKQFELLKSLQ
jgi:hypothetical protein